MNQNNKYKMKEIISYLIKNKNHQSYSIIIVIIIIIVTKIQRLKIK